MTYQSNNKTQKAVHGSLLGDGRQDAEEIFTEFGVQANDELHSGTVASNGSKDSTSSSTQTGDSLLDDGSSLHTG